MMNAGTMAALQKLTKWRAVFTGWQLGTRLKGDPESDAVRDHREVTILLRAEVSALVGLLIRKRIISAQEWDKALGAEAAQLDADYERRFPGISTNLDGLVMTPEATETMKGWRP